MAPQNNTMQNQIDKIEKKVDEHRDLLASLEKSSAVTATVLEQLLKQGERFEKLFQELVPTVAKQNQTDVNRARFANNIRSNMGLILSFLAVVVAIAALAVQFLPK